MFAKQVQFVNAKQTSTMSPLNDMIKVLLLSNVNSNLNNKYTQYEHNLNINLINLTNKIWR